MAVSFPHLVPTRRAVVLLAIMAPVALVIAAAVPEAWVLAPALCGALLFLVFADAAAAGGLREAGLDVPADIEVGAEQLLGANAVIGPGRCSRVDVAVDADARLLPGGRALFRLERQNDLWRGEYPFAATRRGTATVGAFWLRWRGPLGLGARQIRRVSGEEVRIWPNIGAARSPALQTFLRDAQYGTIARRIRGEGTQFESLTDYHPGMDRRRIDWKASARHVKLFAKEFETERNNQIVFAFDCGQAMCEPVDGLPRIDRAVSAALTTAYVALKGGDRVALYGFAARPDVLTPFVSGTPSFHRLQRAAAGLEYHAQEPNFTLALATLASRLQRRSLIVVFSDFTDPTSAELMIEGIGRLVSRHLVLFVTMTDSELEHMADARPEGMEELAVAVTAEKLLRQRALVTRKLRLLGVDVVEAPYRHIGTRLLDAYLAIKRSGAIG